jgi:capsular exopolysaccharide synthesis family protein
MSHIFDALQRAETERSGFELDAFDVPTELLQIAESAARAQSAPVTPRAEESDISPADIQSLIEDLAAAPNPSDQFQSLPVALPPYNKLVAVTEKDGLAAEKFRFLAVRLRQLQQRRPLKRLLITSSMPEEGKSMVAANLACTLASRRQQKVLLLEGDLRRPTIQRQFGLGKISGLSEYLQGLVDASVPAYRLDALGIWVMPTGGVPQNPLELMQCGKLSPLLDRLAACFDWIIIDSPPILPLADTSVWSRLADGILLVARQGTTDRQQLKRGLEAIEPAKLLGALLNSSTSTAHNDYYQRYGHDSASGETAKAKKADTKHKK